VLDSGKPLQQALLKHHCADATGDFTHYLDGVEIAFDAKRNLAFTASHQNIPAAMTAHAKRMEQKIYRVSDKVYCAVGYALANIIFVEGDDGLIVIDTSESLEAAIQIRNDFFAAVPSAATKPIRAVIYTHNHSDHIAGIRAFASDEAVAGGQCWVIAHETLMAAVINNASVVAPILRARSAYSFGALLEGGPEGQVNGGIGPVLVRGATTFIPPTHTFNKHWDVTLAGIRFEFRHAPSETDDEIIAWLPDLKVLLSAEVIQGECLANVHTLRGTKYRDPQQWVKSIDAMRAQHALRPATFMVPAHGRPVGGADNITELLTAYRDAISFIHDQAVRFMNQGASPNELAEILPCLPEHLAKHPWLGEYYGTVKHSVRQVFSGQLGWFDGDPVSLDPLTAQAHAKRWIALAGGEQRLLAEAKAALQSTDIDHLKWAAELSTALIQGSEKSAEILEAAKLLKASAFIQLGYLTTNINWRNWYLTAARELQGKYKTLTVGANNIAAKDILAALPNAQLFELLSVRVAAERCLEEHRWLHFHVDQSSLVSLELRHGVMQIHEVATTLIPDSAPCVVLSRQSLNEMMSQGAAVLPELMAQGKAELKNGTLPDLLKFFSFFDPKPTHLPELASR
jgi:alkyl sulfatase BDS1-like metallo-beta-lactamase superfamily hydrolase